MTGNSNLSLEPIEIDDAALELLVVGHVIGVRMCREQVRHLHLEALDGGHERLDRRAAVDEDGSASRPVRNEVGVREEAGIHAAFDDHGVGRMPGDRRQGGSQWA